jgi:uncharacterized repeat protein (TIGR03837 family)
MRLTQAISTLRMSEPALPSRWDIFCSLIDNYGDVAVAWRLARQLAREHRVAVRLFVDALPTLARLTLEVDAKREVQFVHGVELRTWQGAHRVAPAAAISGVCDVVVEAFGCGLPAAYLDGMSRRRAQPVWINLEYLSAENWIEGCHGLASRQPQLPLTRYFFFPGFTPQTGGLLRERDLFAQRDDFAARPEAQAALWQALGIGAAAVSNALKVSLFCYSDAPIAALLEAWAAGRHEVLCVVPEGVAGDALDAWTRTTSMLSDGMLLRGSLKLARVAFLTQDDYDRLLWTCDLNFVRGEDSFVRAQWAAKPLVWQCYPQAGAAHVAKLDAFLARYDGGLSQSAATAYAVFARNWNGVGNVPMAWEALAAVLPPLRARARDWAVGLASQADLATNLVKFSSSQV